MNAKTVALPKDVAVLAKDIKLVSGRLLLSKAAMTKWQAAHGKLSGPEKARQRVASRQVVYRVAPPG